MVSGFLDEVTSLGWRTFCTLMQVKQMGWLFLSCLAPIDPKQPVTPALAMTGMPRELTATNARFREGPRTCRHTQSPQPFIETKDVLSPRRGPTSNHNGMACARFALGCSHKLGQYSAGVCTAPINATRTQLQQLFFQRLHAL